MRKSTVAQFPGLPGRPDLRRADGSVTLRHHALESGCFVVNATGWLTEAQITADRDRIPVMQKALRGGCCTAIISP